VDLRSLQETWDTLGREDPFGAILDPLRGRTDWDIDDFFASGRLEIEQVLADGGRHGLPRERNAALDFGCGAGRLTQAMASEFATGVGIDIAPSMIDLARRLNRTPERCSFVLNASESLEGFDNSSFDLVYSNITLQHIEPALGRRYIAELARVLRPGGLLVFQLPSGLDTQALPPSAFRAEIELRTTELELPPGGKAAVRAAVRNRGDARWPADVFRRPIRLGNHWRARDGEMLRLDDARAPLWCDVDAGDELELELTVTAPDDPGSYELELDVVQEGVAWFADRGSPTVRLPVVVSADAVAEEWKPERTRPAPRAWKRRPHARLAARAARLRRRLGRSAPDVHSNGNTPEAAMYGIPRADVCDLLEASGTRVVEVIENDAAGPGWISLRYTATKDE